MRLCQKYRICLISDKVYALSVWDNEEALDASEFTFVLPMDLTDDNFTNEYIHANQAKTSKSYKFITRWLKQQGIPYAPGSNSGFFLRVNLRAAVTKAGENYDHELLKSLLKKEKLLLSDALGFSREELGWFGIVFTHHWTFMEMCFGRLAKVIQVYRGVRDGMA
ncbi:hypothetical protein MPH_11547 [Macrophomina phaseolina MS6]|uniref:Aminotransferase class I/classII domain-containing protein n=1 Tax=Macrophomina phaseolina (strain MS6) TaxID=1126212 RepID=K2QN72_MACPH|nr:hypothetical protein MPH_11547 [Macrophomina phaseolina MS6]